MCHYILHFSSEVNLGVERSGFTLVRYHKGISEHDQYVRVILNKNPGMSKTKRCLSMNLIMYFMSHNLALGKVNHATYLLRKNVKE